MGLVVLLPADGIAVQWQQPLFLHRCTSRRQPRPASFLPCPSTHFASDRCLDFETAYLDDVVVAGDATAVLQALHILQQASPDLGLELKLEKCELIPTAGHNNTCSLETFPAAMERKLQCNFDLLGAPIGSESFCKDYIRTHRLGTTRERLAELPGLEDTHAGYKILSTCLGSC